MILLANKGVFAVPRAAARPGRHASRSTARAVGNYGRRVGIVGASLVGRP